MGDTLEFHSSSTHARLSPILADFLPNGVRLTAYGGGAQDLPSSALQEYISAVERGEATVPIDTVFQMEQIAEAHEHMVGLDPVQMSPGWSANQTAGLW